MEVPRVLTACIFLVCFANHCQCCGPAEISKEYVITSTTTNVSLIKTAVWQVATTGSTLYDSVIPVPNSYPHLYWGTKTQLTILNVTINDGSDAFWHLVNSALVYTCKLAIYKKPSTPECDIATLNGNQIRTKCTTAQVFPQAKCQFTLQNGGTDKRDIEDGTTYIAYKHTEPQAGESEYYSTSCTLQYPVDGLKPGAWTIEVSMYPDQTNVSLAEGTVGRANRTIQLSIPTVNIDQDYCPKGLTGEGNANVRQGYIRRGERATCLCTRAHVGNPPGTMVWSSTQGGNVNVLSQSEENATIRFDSSVGPDSASLTFKSTGPIFLCSSQQTNVDITCHVPEDSFKPNVLFTIRVADSNIIINMTAGDIAHNISVNYNFTKSGQHTFTCRAENVVFRDIFSEAPASTIQVYAPPNEAPSLQAIGPSVITDDTDTWAKQGSNITVKCLAGKAYPVVKSVTVACGQEASSNGSLSVYGVSGGEMQCHCTLDHETKDPCNGLNLTKTTKIQVAHGPEEVTISLEDNGLTGDPNEPLNLCSSDGLDLTVVCAVSLSAVKPALTNSSFTLSKPEHVITQQTYFEISEKQFRSVSKLKVISGGNHKLICEAKNSKFLDMKQIQSLTLGAREPPRNPPKIDYRSIQNGDILVEGDDVKVSCEVSGGYPHVQSVKLTCSQNQSLTSEGTSAELILKEIGLSYNETNCTCQATHVTGCYDLIGVLPMIVYPSNQTLFEQEDSPPIGAAVGGAIGTFVVMAVVVGGIYFLRRRMKKKERPYPEEDGYDPHQDPEAVIIDNDLYATSRQEQEVPVSAKDYTTIKPTMESATALPKKYNPENVDNPYEDVKPMELDRKSLAKKSQTKPTPGAKPKIPKTSVKTNAVPKPGEQAQNNTDSEYATVAKTKPPNSKSSDHDQTDDVTAAGATGAMPVVPNKLYDKDELEDSVNQQSASKGKQKKTKEKPVKKEKKKDKKEKMEKGKDTDDDHIYSNETFDRRGDVDVYANITMGMKSSNDVDDGMHKNKDGLVYTTIVGVGSLKGGQRPVHHSRKEASVDYADIDFNKIVANREDQDR